jgi:hypothetical protein
MGAGCTTSIPAAPTMSLETTNWAYVVDVACMTVAMITPKIPASSTILRPNRSESHPTVGRISTDPMDWAALTRPRREPVGCPKYDCHCYVVSISSKRNRSRSFFLPVAAIVSRSSNCHHIQPRRMTATAQGEQNLILINATVGTTIFLWQGVPLRVRSRQCLRSSFWTSIDRGGRHATTAADALLYIDLGSSSCIPLSWLCRTPLT